MLSSGFSMAGDLTDRRWRVLPQLRHRVPVLHQWLCALGRQHHAARRRPVAVTMHWSVNLKEPSAALLLEHQCCQMPQRHDMRGGRLCLQNARATHVSECSATTCVSGLPVSTFIAAIVALSGAFQSRTDAVDWKGIAIEFNQASAKAPARWHTSPLCTNPLTWCPCRRLRTGSKLSCTRASASYIFKVMHDVRRS